MDKVMGQASGDNWTIYHGDCVEIVRQLPKKKIHYAIFSPPFGKGLYVYSASDRDIGNCNSDAVFRSSMKYLAQELSEVMMPGRLVSFHCMNIPLMKEQDGVIGIQDFRGDLIRVFQEVGFIYHSEVCIWKDPVTAMQRTKALGLLHKQIKKDSAMSRQGIPDYLVTMRNPGVNLEPIKHTAEDFPVHEWQHIASPVWAQLNDEYDKFHGFQTPQKGTPSLGVNPSETLQSIAEENDERHICPLQLPVIGRGVRLWTNPGDVVLSPFAGIGSEGYESILQGRRFIGCELKEAYFNQACINLRRADLKLSEGKLFK